MKKVSARFVILCIVVVLIGVTALAVGGSVSNLQKQDANVEVETITTEEGEPTFRITRSNAEDGKLYTVLIRSGAEDEAPSGGENGNMVYMDMVKAQNGVVSISKAYPKTMTDGTYRVFMSDYQQGELKQVATFEVSGSGDKPADIKLGDLDNDGERTIDDIAKLIKLVANRATLEEAGVVADLDGDKEITVDDIAKLIKIVANRE